MKDRNLFLIRSVLIMLIDIYAIHREPICLTLLGVHWSVKELTCICFSHIT